MTNAPLLPLIRRRADHAGVTCLSDASCTLQCSLVRCCNKTTFSVLAPVFARFKSWRSMPPHPPQAWRKVHARPRSHHPTEVCSRPHRPQPVDHLQQDPRGIISGSGTNLRERCRLVRVSDQSLDRRSPWLACGSRSGLRLQGVLIMTQEEPQTVPCPANDEGPGEAPLLDPRIVLIAQAIGRKIARDLARRPLVSNDNQAHPPPESGEGEPR